MIGPTAIIGDIHGEADHLAALLPSLNGRRLIFVGDYVNRGPESPRVIEQLITLKRAHADTVCLLGNHEVAFLSFLAGTMPFYEFAGVGGIATIRSYISHVREDVRQELVRAIPYEHRLFIGSCGLFFETDDLFVSHCGIDPSDPLSRQEADVVMSRHESLFAPKFSAPKLVVCGHYAQGSRAPYVNNNFICIDTGCGTFGGPLTALLLPERTFVQG